MGICLVLWAVSAAGASPLLDDGTPDPTWAGNSMLLWLKADAGFSAGPTTTWADQSTNGYVASQSTAANQPTPGAGVLGGQPAVLFDGNDYLTIPGGPTGQQTAFFVYRDTSTAAWVTPVGTVYDGKGSYHGHSGDTQLFNTTYTDAKSINGANYRDGASIGDGLSTPRPDSWALDAHVATAPLGQVVSTIGADNAAPASRAINGGIAEVILYDRPLNDSQRNAVGYYLANKYGLSTSYYDPTDYGTGVWNVHDDWDPADGTPDEPPARAWYYRETPGGSYSDLPNWGNLGWWAGGNARLGAAGSYPAVGPRIGDFDHAEATVDAYIAANNLDLQKLIMMHPGPSDDQTAVVTWRNPVPGRSPFEFDGVFWHVDDTGTNGIDVSISMTEEASLVDILLDGSLTGLGSSTVTLNAADGGLPDNAPFSFKLFLNHGDEVHFRVNARGGHSSDASMFGLQVRLVPEPAAWLLLLAGAAGLACLRRRRKQQSRGGGTERHPGQFALQNVPSGVQGRTS
jgi:hypothetical protein